MEVDEQAEKTALREWISERAAALGDTQESLAKTYHTSPRTVRKAMSDGDKSLPNGMLTYLLLRRYGGVTFTGAGTAPSIDERLRHIELMLEQLLSPTQVATVRVLMAEGDLGRVADG